MSAQDRAQDAVDVDALKKRIENLEYTIDVYAEAVRSLARLVAGGRIIPASSLYEVAK